MGDGSMDDDFAAFLGELGEVEATVGKEASPPPSPKRARTGDAPAAEAAVVDAQAAEAAARTKRQTRAEKLRKASFQGDAEKVERILQGLSAVDRLLIVDSPDDEDGFAALHLAAIGRHAAVASVLLRFRADVDVATTGGGDTPLMWAAHRGSTELCRVLLHAGADATLTNARGQTAVRQARAAGHVRLSEWIENHAFDVAAGLLRRGAAQVDAAAARRAANLKLVAAAIREQGEKEEEEAFWAGIRARREGREAEEATRKEGAGAGASAAEAAGAPVCGGDAAAELDLSSVPERLRPHYRLLEAPADAMEGEVRRLYRKLALRHHPDKNPADLVAAKERFGKIAVAYEAVCEHLASAAHLGARVAPPKF